MAIELYLFRHGRTAWNALGKYQGHADVNLDALGRAQALAVAERCRGIRPTMLYTSDLRRCADVAREAGIATQLEMITDERLRERDVGDWSGLTRAEIAQKDPDDLRRWQEGDDSIRPGGGESVEEIKARVSSFFDTIRALGEGRVVAISHGGWIRSATEWVFGNTLPRRSLGVPAQGSLTVFMVSEDDIALEAYNDRGHLMSVEPIDEEPPAPRIF